MARMEKSGTPAKIQTAVGVDRIGIVNRLIGKRSGHAYQQYIKSLHRMG